MIITSFLGLLGNQMFQYAIGRIIAEKKGYQLEFHNHSEHVNPTAVRKYFPNATPITDGIAKSGNPLMCGYTCAPPHHLMQHLDMEEILNHNGTIFLHGYWQKHYYYTQHAEQIKKWYQYDDSSYAKPGPNDIVIHFRLGEFLTLGQHLSPKVFINIIEKLDYDKCIIVSDMRTHPILNEFDCLKNVVINNGSLIEDFTLMKCAKRLFISQSTLSWWAAFLGDQEAVYAPLNLDPSTRNPWKNVPLIDDTDLIPDNKKFVKILI